MIVDVVGVVVVDVAGDGDVVTGIAPVSWTPHRGEGESPLRSADGPQTEAGLYG